MNRSDLFLKSNRWFSRFLTGLRAIHTGFWLGLLDQQSLQDLTTRQYANDDSYAEEAYNLGGLHHWEERIIEEYFSGCRTLLIGAAGAGREIIALSRRGFQVDGFDCSPRFLERARSLCEAEGVAAKLFLAAPGEAPDEPGVYDGLIMGWGGYIHIPGRERRIRFLREFRRHVKTGGPILVSFISREGEGGRARITYAVARLVNALRLNREAVEVGDTLSGNWFQHEFSEAEVRDEFEAAGIRMVRFSGRFGGCAVGVAKEQGPGTEVELPLSH